MSLLIFHTLLQPSQSCELLTSDTDHKSLWPLCPIETFCFLLVFIICNLANATGIGGGGMLVPLLIILMEFQAHEAIPLSKSIILGGAVVSVIMSLLEKSKNLLDFRIVSLLQPMILLGTAAGVTLNQLFPDKVILVMLVFTLGYVIYKTATKAVNLFKKESEVFRKEREKVREEGLRASELKMISANSTQEVSFSLEDSRDEVSFPIRSIFLIVLNYFAVLLFALAKGGAGPTGVPSVVGLAPCSTAYWLLITFYTIFCIVSTLLAQKYAAPTISWSIKNLLCYSTIAFLGGIGSGLLGLGGGLIISPLMLDIGISPQTTAASSSLMVLFTSSSTTLQFYLGDMLDLQYAAVMFCISMLSSLTGITIVGRLVKKYRRPSIIVFLLAGVTAFSAVLLPVYTYYMQRSDSIHGVC